MPPSRAGGVLAMNEIDAPRPADPGFRPRLAALARARWWPIVAFLLALGGIDLIRIFSLREFGPGGFAQWVISGLTGSVIAGGGGVAGTLVAEAMALRGATRGLVTIALAFVGTAIGFGFIVVALPSMTPDSINPGAGVTLDAWVLRGLWYYSATGLLLAAYFATRDRDAATARLAQAAELERGGVQRAVMESRLRVIQARVEPELLFDVLADVQRLYAKAPADAEALLDDLIVYLRAALPQMRGDSSTLAQEAALASAYLKVTPAAREGTLAYVERIPEALLDLPFPPMVLLPLLHAAADARAPSMTLAAVARDGDDPARAWVSVSVAIPAGTRTSAWDGDRLAAVREIAMSYFGEGTTLTVRGDANGTTAVLRFAVPREILGSAAAPGAVRAII
ncbi:MAG: histidine kinase [Casimicrobiaceae bacterium]